MSDFSDVIFYPDEHTDVRLFYLLNKDNVTYHLTSTNALLTEPKGLGFKRENGYRRVGNHFTLVTKAPTQTTFEGTVLLTPPNAYVKYRDFIKFCLKEPLQLVYRPFDKLDLYNAKGKFEEAHSVSYGPGAAYTYATVNEPFRYRKNVYIEEIEKEELTKYGALEVKIKFTPTTPWYSEYIYGVDPSLNVSSSNPNTVLIDCDAQIDSPCQICIRGPATNPTWAHYNYVNGNSVTAETGKVFTILESNQWLLIDNRYSAETVQYRYIRICNSSGAWIGNIQNLSDFSRERWVNFTPGLNRISVWADSGSPTIQWINVRRFYESV